MPDPKRANGHTHVTSNQISQELIKSAGLEIDALYKEYSSTPTGLSDPEVQTRLQNFGLNQILHKEKLSLLGRFWSNIKNPLVILLAVLGVVSYFTGDLRAASVIGIMLLLGIVLRFVQESRADHAAEELQKMVSTTATVIRNGEKREIPMQDIVPGDLIALSAGDLVPADVRILTSKDLFLNQAALTGETMPVEKHPEVWSGQTTNAFEIHCLCFQGSNVQSGSGTALVVHTGSRTFFGSMTTSLAEERESSSFDKGVNSFTWLMISFIAIMVPLVFLLNGLFKHNWLEAFLFALAVAVGLTPEMLPMIVTVNLSKGAIQMGKKKVIVKRLNAIQNFGAMDVLCTDKTGTITQGKIVLEQYIDPAGNESDDVLYMAYLNSYYQTGLKNLMDEAVLDHVQLEHRARVEDQFSKVDEIPFDFQRRRMSVVVEDSKQQRILITKGAVDEILEVCDRVEYNGEVFERKPDHDEHRRQRVTALSSQGFRVIALAYKPLDGCAECTYETTDESKMILKGFLAFLDPPKETTPMALKKLGDLKVGVKILTGDNDLVTTTVCKKVGLSVEKVLLGGEIEEMSDRELSKAAEEATVFARLSPAHKERIIRALQEAGHVVGFMGDGINDAPALKAADVGISVDSAVDIAKESSDIILLETSLLVLGDGVIEGRKVFGNIIKYIKMAASSNFGNMFSVVGASIFLPFIPMLPIQILTNNLLYDFSQTAIPTDEVDREWLDRPRKWGIEGLRRFIMLIGPLSSIFDYATFFLMLYVFNCWNNPDLFHTGWFVESLITQTLIIHVIRTDKIPFIQSRASTPLLITSLVIAVIGIALPYSPLASTLGLVPLPILYWVFLAVMMIMYVLLTQAVKTWFIRKYGE